MLYLDSLGDVNFDAACNGALSIDLIISSSSKGKFYDVIIMDCNMPIMDGYEATKRITSMIAKGIIPWVPVIAATANSSEMDFEKCCRHGMAGFLAKPFSRSQLREKIQECTKNNR